MVDLVRTDSLGQRRLRAQVDVLPVEIALCEQPLEAVATFLDRPRHELGGPRIEVTGQLLLARGPVSAVERIEPIRKLFDGPQPQIFGSLAARPVRVQRRKDMCRNAP